MLVCGCRMPWESRVGVEWRSKGESVGERPQDVTEVTFPPCCRRSWVCRILIHDGMWTDVEFFFSRVRFIHKFCEMCFAYFFIQKVIMYNHYITACYCRICYPHVVRMYSTSFYCCVCNPLSNVSYITPLSSICLCCHFQSSFFLFSVLTLHFLPTIDAPLSFTNHCSPFFHQSLLPFLSPIVVPLSSTNRCSPFFPQSMLPFLPPTVAPLSSTNRCSPFFP